MGKVVLVYGKMGSGKSTYANSLAEKLNAVVIAHDDIMLGLFGGELYESDKKNSINTTHGLIVILSVLLMKLQKLGQLLYLQMDFGHSLSVKNCADFIPTWD